MRPTRLAATLAALPLAVAGCGAAAQSPPGDHGGHTGTAGPPSPTTHPPVSRPAAEKVPLGDSKVTLSWSLAPGGTPVLKVLFGADATRLARDFNSLAVDTEGMRMCPMIPSTESDITVTFTADGHTWKAYIPACPDIRVSRDGTVLPSLELGYPFLADVKAYTGYLPHFGPPQAPGGVIPMHHPPTP